jgi:hypothetical protein
MKPFAMANPSQFGPNPTISLESTEWATDFNELEDYDGKTCCPFRRHLLLDYNSRTMRKKPRRRRGTASPGRQNTRVMSKFSAERKKLMVIPGEGSLQMTATRGVRRTQPCKPAIQGSQI